MGKRPATDIRAYRKAIRAGTAYPSLRALLAFGWLIAFGATALLAISALIDPPSAALAATVFVGYAAVYAVAVSSLDSADIALQSGFRTSRMERLQAGNDGAKA